MAAKKQRGLGRGLDVLLGKKMTPATSEKASEGLKEVAIEALVAGRYQPRTKMDEASLNDLAASIRQEGIISPILVRSLPKNRFEIIAGERRYRAAQIAGLKKVPVIVRKIGDEQALAIALIENIQREDLNPLEEATGIDRLVKEFKMTHETAAKAVGKSRSQVTNLLRLLKLTKPVQELLLTDALSMGHARALLALDGGDQVATAQEVIAKRLSVYQTEKLIAARKAENSAKPKQKGEVDADTLKAQNALADVLGAPVRIRANKKGKGRLVIEFSNYDELDGLLERFGVKS
ncbi:MAG TPA: chromosome partitioning protein ParB [Sutterella sp.]|nr:chromosome partitioning protein ParB [Sutterella sp.]